MRHPLNPSLFRQLAYQFLGRKEQHQAILCFDHYFINFPSTATGASNAEVAIILNDFWNHCQILREFVQTLDITDEATQKLFNFRPASIENAYRLKPSTWLYRMVTAAKPHLLEGDEDSVVIAQDELLMNLKTQLWDRLAKRLEDENERCHHRVAAFVPCLPYVINSQCRRVECRRQHIDYQQLTPTWFNTQVRIHFLQILIYQVYHSIPVDKLWLNTISERR